MIFSLFRLLFLKIKALITGKPTPWAKENPHNQLTTVKAEAEKYPTSIAVTNASIFNHKLSFDGIEIRIKDIEKAEKIGLTSDRKRVILKVQLKNGEVYIFEATDKMYARINMDVGIPSFLLK